MAARGRRVLLVELDSGPARVDYIAGVYGKTVYDVEDVLNGPLRSRQGRGGKPCVPQPVCDLGPVLRRTYPAGQRCACL